MLKSSPFEAVYRQLGANFEEYDGWSLPSDFGDLKAEKTALKEHCAVVDLSSFGRINLKGEIKEILNSVYESKSGHFMADRWVWAKAKTKSTELICRVARTNGDCTILTPPGKNDVLLDIIQTKAGRGEVTTTDITEKTAMLGLYGPTAVKSIRGILPFDIDQMEQGDAARMSFFMMSFTIMRGSWLGHDGLELICPASAGPMAAGAVVKYRHKHNITPAGMKSLRMAMEQMKPPL